MGNIGIEGKVKPLLQNGKVADAVDVEIDATGFDGNLADTDVNVQLVAQALDDLDLGSAINPLTTAANVSFDSASVNGLLVNSPNVQNALERLDATGLGASVREFTGSFFCSSFNQDQWYGGRQTVFMRGARGQTNARRTFELPDTTELNAIFDDMVSRGLGEVYTLTVEYFGGTSPSIVNNSLTIRPPSISALFTFGQLPVTIASGSSATFRIDRAGVSLGSWERLSVQQAADPVATFGEVVLQNISWNNSDSSFLPSGGQVLKGYAFPVLGSNPNDGSLRQGLLDGGVSDRTIYDGDYVVWTADAFTSWLDGDNWFVLSRNDMQRISTEAVNFLSSVSEIDNRVDIGTVGMMGAQGFVWLSENPLAEAPFINPSSDGNNPRSGDDYAYLGGAENQDMFGRFQFGQNRFDSYLTIGITPSFISGQPEEDIFIVVSDGTDGSELQRLSLATDFTFTDDATFTNGTFRHYKSNTSFNYPFLATIGVWVTQVRRHFRMDPVAVDVTENIPQGSLVEQRLSPEVREKLNRALPDPGTDFSSIQDRLSPYETVSTSFPANDALFLSSDGTGAYPQGLTGFVPVSADNPRFTNNNVAMYVAVPTPGSFVLSNITASSVVVLDDASPNVEVVESINSNGTTFFIYRVTSLTSGHVFEVDRTTSHQVVAWQEDITNLEDDIRRIDAELAHAALGLDASLIDVLDNEVTVNEESTPSSIPTTYNEQLAGPANGTQTVFRETNPNTFGGGTLASKPIADTAGTDRERQKLLYIPEGTTYTNQAYVGAFDGTTGRDLVTYTNGTFNAKVFVAAKSAGSSSETVYPAPANRVSGSGIWHNIPALTFVNGIPEPEADELFFSRNIPTTPTTVTIQYRGHANGNVFGAGSTTLAGVGGTDQTFANTTLNTGGEAADVEFRWDPSRQAIRVSITEHVSTGLPTINDVEVILSYTETRVIPSTPETTRDVPIEFEHSGWQVFGFKPSSTGTLIIVGDQTEIDTGYLYTVLFGASETGHLFTTAGGSTFLDFEDFEPIATTVTDLENHATLPQFGLFSTVYTHGTVVEFDTQMQVKNSQGDDVLVGQELILVAPDNDRWRLSVNNSGVLATAKVT